MAHTDDEQKRPELEEAAAKVRADLRIVVKKDVSEADCVTPSRPPVLLDPDKPLEP